VKCPECGNLMTKKHHHQFHCVYCGRISLTDDSGREKEAVTPRLKYTPDTGFKLPHLYPSKA